jgi:hypothetical protein
VRDPAVAAVLDRPGELHAARGEVAHRALDVVAVERDVVRAGVAGVLDRVDAEVALGEVEDPPALADVAAGHVDAADHGDLLARVYADHCLDRGNSPMPLN